MSSNGIPRKLFDYYPKGIKEREREREREITKETEGTIKLKDRNRPKGLNFAFDEDHNLFINFIIHLSLYLL
jgi:hypothetical protein